MAKQFFIADTHFGHKRIMELEKRPFKDTDEMDRTIIDNWNKTVSDEDTVYILGDFSLTPKEEIPELVKKLKGHKILILGNQDRKYEYSWWNSIGFDMVSTVPIVVNEWYMLSHEPMYICDDMPYMNIFGHVHGNPQYKDYSKMHFCVSCERINYTPIEFNDMIKKMQNS